MPNPQHLVVNNPKPPLAGVFLHINAAEGFPDGSRSGILLRAETYLVKLPGEAASAALLQAARTLEKERVYLLIKVLGGAGLRIQELPQLTAEAVRSGSVELRYHNDRCSRVLRLPGELREELLF